MKPRLMAILTIAGLTGCVSNQPKQNLAVDRLPTGSIPVVMEVCRPASITRSVEAPDLLLDGEVVAEITNGSSFKIYAYEGASVELFLQKNMLVYRFSDTTIYSDTLGVNPLYVLVNAEANFKGGLTVLFGGAIAESARQEVDNKSVSDSWTVLMLSESAFREKCAG